MSTLAELLTDRCDLAAPDSAWLHRLVGDWQVLADVTYTDLLLWVPARDDTFVVVALCRPATAATGYVDDPVGSSVPRASRPELVTAMTGETATTPPGAEHPAVDAVPVVRAGQVLGVLTLRQSRGVGKLSSLERAYLSTADALLTMVREGTFPDESAPTGAWRGAPRVGDGLIRLDADGVVVFATPNALSCFHRLGYIGGMVNELLAGIVTDLVVSPAQALVDESLPLVVTGRAAMRAQLLSRRDVAVSLRAIPLLRGGVRDGAVLLCRDITEVHRGERELMTKDATIREIHHRVKNNLQTVSALLRMQARRMESKKARAALEEAMRRVATIALVHETLSAALDETLDLDALLRKVLDLVVPLVRPGEAGDVRVRRTGSGGLVRAKEANPLALVVMELVANALEHTGDSPQVEVRLERERDVLVLTVLDDGPGLPKRFVPGSGGMGTQIVQALVTGELHGTIDWRARPEGGTAVQIRCSVPEVED